MRGFPSPRGAQGEGRWWEEVGISAVSNLALELRIGQELLLKSGFEMDVELPLSDPSLVLKSDIQIESK